LRSFVGVTEAMAQDTDAEEAKQDDADGGEHAADVPETDGEATAEAEDGEDSEDGEEHVAAAEDTQGEDEERQAPRARDTGPQFSRAEIEMLQSLMERRETLDLRSRELDIRGNLLIAAELRIDEKIAQLKSIEATIQGLLKQHDDQEEKKLRSLVRIYESMKPKQAARIFEELDIDILIDVAERMNERKFAPILAQMNPERAKAVTVEIRTRQKLPQAGGG
jgi:flagellar motility protein MotE (MotC chaperone)